MTVIVLGLLLLGFAIAAPLTGLLTVVGKRVGALDGPGAKGHVKEVRVVPNIGGIAIFVGAMVPVACALGFFILDPEGAAAWAPAIKPHLVRAHATKYDWLVIVLGAIAVHLLGLYDDRRALSAWPKLFLQVSIALATTLFSDVRLLAEYLSPIAGGELFAIALTVAWIVVVMNAVNFMDNMDGLAAGIGLIAALCFMAATMTTGQWFVASALALLAGSLAGFLVWNIPPASIFMGDGGSLFVGYMLATLSARTAYIDTQHADYALGTAWYGVLMPLLVLAIPLYDGVYVTVWRVRRGKSPFVGGPEHISHRLVQLGLSKRRSVAVLWLLTLVTAVSGIGLGLMKPWQAMLIGVQLFAIYLVMLILETSVARIESPPTERGKK